jgi:predicted homoserine dehydrogenase-like protein
MNDRIRVGVIGAGVMGRYHCETLALRLTGAELAGALAAVAGGGVAGSKRSET